MTAAIDPSKQSKRSTTLRDERLQQLMENCQQEVLRQIIGPFGLKPAMLKESFNSIPHHQTERKNADTNPLRKAFGVLLCEFLTGSFTEIKTLLKERNSERNMIDQIIESMKRVIKKLKAAWDTAIDGCVSGLMTFLINSVITTSKKIVTIIRESITSLCKVFRLMKNPPEGMSSFEITREV